jgi:hypothetical protein
MVERTCPRFRGGERPGRRRRRPGAHLVHGPNRRAPRRPLLLVDRTRPPVPLHSQPGSFDRLAGPGTGEWLPPFLPCPFLSLSDTKKSGKLASPQRTRVWHAGGWSRAARCARRPRTAPSGRNAHEGGTVTQRTERRRPPPDRPGAPLPNGDRGALPCGRTVTKPCFRAPPRHGSPSPNGDFGARPGGERAGRQDQFLDVIDRDEAQRRCHAALDLRPRGARPPAIQTRGGTVERVSGQYPAGNTGNALTDGRQ